MTTALIISELLPFHDDALLADIASMSPDQVESELAKLDAPSDNPRDRRGPERG